MDWLVKRTVSADAKLAAKLDHEAAAALIRQCPLYEPTPALDRPDLARALGLGQLVIKHEARRLGLTSFKSLGGAYAIIRHLAEKFETGTGRRFTADDFHRRAFRDLASKSVFAAATDGNHGLSVAAGARAVGATANIFVHQRVPDYRIARLKEKGANVTVVPGVFDNAVAEAGRQAAERGWVLVADTTENPDDAVPKWVLDGYTLLASEMMDQTVRPPTHAVLHAGVGGLAAACMDRWKTLSPRPACLIVEPAEAPALFESFKTGRMISVPDDSAGSMEMLECYRPSRLAWDILEPLTTACFTVTSAEAEDAVLALAKAGFDTTPSGAAAFAGLYKIARDDAARQACGLTDESVVWLVISEGRGP